MKLNYKSLPTSNFPCPFRDVCHIFGLRARCALCFVCLILKKRRGGFRKKTHNRTRRVHCFCAVQGALDYPTVDLKLHLVGVRIRRLVKEVRIPEPSVFFFARSIFRALFGLLFFLVFLLVFFVFLVAEKENMKACR